MTEQEWLESGQWSPLWFYSSDIDLLTVRKLRLFAAGACRRFAHRFVDPRTLFAVEICERCADGGVETDDEMNEARDEAGAAAYGLSGIFQAAAYSVCPLSYADPGKVGRAAEGAPYVHACEALIAAGLISPERTLEKEDELRQHPIFLGGMAAGERIQADLLREVIGNPFRPVSLDSGWLAWNDSTIRRIAQSIYHDRAFDRLPILADALEEAGCDNKDILDHCRQPGVHVRGCWAVDLLLDKE